MKKIFLLSSLILISDQLIKIIIKAKIVLGKSIPVIKDFFGFTYVQNTGAAFSILKDSRFFLIAVALIILFLIYYFLIKDNELDNLESIAYGLLIGGILGNLMDRIIFGYVTDYMEFRLFNYNFPIFNLADSCIILAFGLLVITMFITKKEEEGI